MTEAGTTSSRATSDGAPAQSKASKVIVVDRTLHPLLSSTVTTPSTSSSTSSSTATATATSTSASPANSISSSLERLHRLHGSSLIQSSSYLLSLSPSTTATALAIFHRFYHRTSLAEVDVWSTSMACVSVAGKVEEDLRRLSQIVAVFVHLYRRRRLGVGDDDGRGSYGNHVSRSGNNSAHNSTSTGTGTTSTSSILTDQQKSNLLRYVRPLPQNGPVYQAWSSALLETETLILRQLGFTLYWIPDHHPHKFILYFLRVLRLDRDADGDSKGGGGKVGDGGAGGGNGIGIGRGGKGSSDGTESSSVAQRSWNYCNDACLLDLSVRYEPEIIACAAILLATSHNISTTGSEEATAPSTTLPPMHPRPWWEVFVGPDREDDVMEVCNALLALASPGSDGEDDHRQETNGWEEQKRRAMRQFVPSLVVGGSFNDPGSYVWKALAD